jgi:glycosyltransferase involved in cell wall biosynthesis
MSNALDRTRRAPQNLYESYIKKQLVRMSEKKKLSVVVPVYNEKDTIREIVSRIKAVEIEGVDLELILVDDGSTDGTRDILRNEIEKQVSKVVFHEHNAGKGAALRTGFQHVSGDFAIVQDADLEYNPTEYPRMLAPLLDGRADVVFGSRFKGEGAHRVLYFWHYVGNIFLTLVSNMFTNLNLTDMETCYKAFRAEVIKKINIEQDRFGFEPEVTAKVARLHCRVYEVGISYSGRTYEEGKKIGLKDAFVALWCIIKYHYKK